MGMTPAGSSLLQGLGALCLLGSLGAFAASEKGGSSFAMIGGLQVLLGLVLLYLGGKKKPVARG